MKATVRRCDFFQALTAAAKPVSPRSPLAVLTGVLVEAGRGTVRVTGTDIDTTVSAACPAEVGGEGAAVVPARPLVELVRRAPGEEVEISASSTAASVRYSGGSADFAVFPADEFVLPSDVEGVELRAGEDVWGAAESVVYAASRDVMRAILTGVQLEVKGGSLTLAASDGHRLAVATVGIDCPGEVRQVVPADAVRLVLQLLRGAVDDVAAVIGPSAAVFRAGPVEVHTRLLEGAYPDWRSVVPLDLAGAVFSCRGADLAGAMERAEVLASGEVGGVRLKLAGEALTVEAGSDAGSFRETLAVRAAGGARDAEVAVRSRYLLEALRHIGAGDVAIGLPVQGGPVVVRASGAGDRAAAVMPLVSL